MFDNWKGNSVKKRVSLFFPPSSPLFLLSHTHKPQISGFHQTIIDIKTTSRVRKKGGEVGGFGKKDKRKRIKRGVNNLKEKEVRCVRAFVGVCALDLVFLGI